MDMGAMLVLVFNAIPMILVHTKFSLLKLLDVIQYRLNLIPNNHITVNKNAMNTIIAEQTKHTLTPFSFCSIS